MSSPSSGTGGGRQRSKREKVKTDDPQGAGSAGGSRQTFQEHVQQDSALHQPPGSSSSSNDIQLPGLTTVGRLSIFLGFPFLVATTALYISYIATLYNPERRKLDVDTDFVFPFLVALLLAIVVGFQTGGYTSVKPKPLVSWPKVRRTKTVVRKVVIVDDDDYDSTGEAAKKKL